MRTFQTTEQALCYLLECEMATLAILKVRSRVVKAEVERHEAIISAQLEAVRAFCKPADAKYNECIRLMKALGWE